MSQDLKKINFYWLLSIFLFALSTRFFYFFQSRSFDPLFYRPIMDALYHHNWAISIVTGDWLGNDSFFRAPLYPYFLALIYKIFGINLIMPRIIQIIFGSLSCLLVERIGTNLFSKKVGILAGFIAAIYPLFIFFDNELLLPALLIFLILSGFYLILKQSRDGGTKLDWFLTGVVWGLAAITRPNVLLFLVVLPFWLRKKLKKQLGVALTFGILGVTLAIAPVTIRNYIVSKEFVPIAWQGGVNFYIGNNPYSDGKTAIVPGTRKSWWGGFYDAKRIAEQTIGRQLKNSEIDRYWLNQGIKFIETMPLNALLLFLKKTYLFFGGYEISNNRDIYFFTRPTYLKFLLFKLPFFQFPFGLLLPLSIMGGWFAFKNKKDSSLILIFVGSYALSFILFFVCERYRLPIISFLIILSSFAIWSVIEQIRKRKYDNLQIPLIILITSVIFLNANLFHIKDNPALNYLILADVEFQKSNYKKAISYFEKALPQYSKDAEVLNQLGTCYYQLGNYDDAFEYYLKSINYNPKQFEPYANIGNIYYQHGDYKNAQVFYLRALELNPNFAIAYNNLGNMYFVQDSLKKALECYNKASDLSPNLINALFYAGVIEQKFRNTARAEALWKRVLVLEPNHRDALKALSMIRNK